MGSKLEELERLRSELTAKGWLSRSDAISTATLDRDAIDHFTAALLVADNVIAWSMGYEDKYGASPDRNHVLSATIHQLISELSRIQAGANSTLFSREGKRHNSRQVDPAFVDLKIMVGVFDRHFSKFYKSAHAKHTAVVSALAEVGIKIDAASVRRWIAWFKQSSPVNRRARKGSSGAALDRERRKTATTAFWELELTLLPPRMRRGDAADREAAVWLLENIARAAKQCPTLRLGETSHGAPTPTR
jgi:hypothetical protein